MAKRNYSDHFVVGRDSYTYRRFELADRGVFRRTRGNSIGAAYAKARLEGEYMRRGLLNHIHVRHLLRYPDGGASR